jgi:hypothetical protein
MQEQSGERPVQGDRRADLPTHIVTQTHAAAFSPYSGTIKYRFPTKVTEWATVLLEKISIAHLTKNR